MNSELDAHLVDALPTLCGSVTRRRSGPMCGEAGIPASKLSPPWRGKLNVTTRHRTDVRQSAHNMAFMVAGNKSSGSRTGAPICAMSPSRRADAWRRSVCDTTEFARAARPPGRHATRAMTDCWRAVRRPAQRTAGTPEDACSAKRRAGSGTPP